MQHVSLLYCSTNLRDNVVRGASFWRFRRDHPAAATDATPVTEHRGRWDRRGDPSPPTQLGDMHRLAGKRRRRPPRPDYTPNFLSSCAFARLTASCAPPRSSAVIPPLP